MKPSKLHRSKDHDSDFVAVGRYSDPRLVGARLVGVKIDANFYLSIFFSELERYFRKLFLYSFRAICELIFQQNDFFKSP